MSRPESELAHLFRALKAPAAARALPKLADRARQEEWSYEKFAATLLKTETDSRDSHGGQARIKAARFPARKTLEEFDFAFQASIRRDTVLHTALQVVSDTNTLLTPFLPHAAQKVYQALGGSGVWAAQPEIRQVSEDGGPDYPVLMGEYHRGTGEGATLPEWAPRPVVPGTPVAAPTPRWEPMWVFTIVAP